MATENPIHILCIEVSNAVTSVAIGKDGETLLVKDVQEPNRAADMLHLLIQQLLDEVQLAFTDLSAVAISSGPGSFTGLRIAAAAAKGYCFSLEIPLIAVPTLEAMVYGIQNRYQQVGFDVYVPMMDARRMEVFTSFYTKEMECIRYFPSLIIDETFPDYFQPDKKYLLFGNGAFKAENGRNGSNLLISDQYIPGAEDLVSIAFSLYSGQKWADIAYFEPNYAKAFYSTTPKNA